jgi:regulatory protein
LSFSIVAFLDALRETSVVRKRKQRLDRGEESSKPLDPEKMRLKTLNRAVKLLTYKPRSKAELRERLLEKDWANPAIVDEAIEKLESYGYVNDRQFAEGLAAAKLRQKPVGKIRLRQSLIRKKLDKETLEQALDKAYEDKGEAELIDQAIEKRLRQRGRPKSREDAKKLFDHLMRQGFAYDLVREKMREIGRETAIEVENED